MRSYPYKSCFNFKTNFALKLRALVSEDKHVDERIRILNHRGQHRRQKRLIFMAKVFESPLIKKQFLPIFTIQCCIHEKDTRKIRSLPESFRSEVTKPF